MVQNILVMLFKFRLNWFKKRQGKNRRNKKAKI